MATDVAVGELCCGKLWMAGGRTLCLPAVYLPDSAGVVWGARGRTVRTEVTAVLPSTLCGSKKGAKQRMRGWNGADTAMR